QITTTYTYDIAGQVASSEINGRPSASDYDDNGNPIQVGIPRYGNRSTQAADNSAIVYDAEGNVVQLTQQLVPEKHQQSYKQSRFYYDHANRLVRVETRFFTPGQPAEAWNPSEVTDFVYDAEGRLLQKTLTYPKRPDVSPQVERYASDGPNVWADLN